METAIILREDAYLPATITARRGNYDLALPNGAVRTLERDKHFGAPKKKDGSNVFPQPILYKGGAELVIHDYRVFPRYDMIHSIHDVENGFFYFEIQCRLVAINPATGAEIVVMEGFGSANTREGKSGTASGFDQANPAIKSAKKRAMVDAAINLAGLSSLFTQDMENDTFMKSAAEIVNAKPDDVITSGQRRRLFALGENAGMKPERVKTFLLAEGFASTKSILQKDYDILCEKLERIAKEG